MGGQGSKSESDRERRIRSIQESFVREREYRKADAEHVAEEKNTQRTRLIETPEGKTFSRTVPADRYYVIHIPMLSKNKRVPLLMVFHGKHEYYFISTLLTNSSAWSITRYSTWIQYSNKEGFIVVFPQARGVVDEKIEWRTDAFWELSALPHADIQYIEDIFNDLSQQNIEYDLKRVFAMGHSNGGLFMGSMALYYDNTKFAAICNHMGGLSEPQIPPDYVPKPKETLIPMYIITGTRDTMLANCMRARRVFSEYGHTVKYEEIEGAQHEYQPEKEEEIYSFFMSCVNT